jgi:hypothetical protein
VILFVESHLREKQRVKKYKNHILPQGNFKWAMGIHFFERLKSVEFLRVIKMSQDARQNKDMPASRADSSL